MRTIYTLTAIVCFALVAVSCGKKSTHISLESESLNIAVSGGESKISVDADGDWELKCDAEWLEALRSEKTLLLNVQPNESGSDRCDTIVLFSGDVESKLIVRQYAKATYLRADKKSVTLPMKGGSASVNVSCDGLNVEATCEEFSVSLQNGVLTIKANPNDGGGLLGEVALRCDTCVCYVEIVQQGNSCMMCGGEGKIVCPKCHGSYHTSEACPECQGAGYQVCCEGTGRAYCQEKHLPGCKVVCPECRGNGHDFDIEEEEEDL